MSRPSFQEWVDQVLLPDLPEEITVGGNRLKTADWLQTQENHRQLAGVYNDLYLTDAEKDKAGLLGVNTGGVVNHGEVRNPLLGAITDPMDRKPGSTAQYHTAGPTYQVLTLNQRKHWQDVGDQQDEEQRLFDRTSDGGFKLRSDLVEVNPGRTSVPPKPSSAVVGDILGSALLRGYLGASASSIAEPSRSPEYFFGRLGQAFTDQGRAQFRNSRDQLGRELVHAVRSGEAGLLGQALSVLPDPILRYAPVVPNTIGGFIGDVVGLWPARFAWRAHPFDFGATHLARDYAQSQGIDSARATGNLDNRAYNPTADRALTARLGTLERVGGRTVLRGNNLRDIALHEPAPFLRLGIGTGALAATVMSGNTGPWQGTDEGFRRPGYAAVAASADDPRKTDFALMSITSPLTGGSSRLLPWEQFRQERPDVSEEKYRNYRAYLRGDTDETPENDFSLLGGLIKGTTSNLDGEMELSAVGGRVTPMGVIGGLAAGAGAISLLSNWMHNGVQRKPMPVIRRGGA